MNSITGSSLRRARIVDASITGGTDLVNKQPASTEKTLTQDPHALRETREKNLEVAIGRQVRELRKRQRMTGSELAGQAGLSVGMLSKIENGVISPSLTTLQILANALRVPLVQLFSGYEEPRGAMHVKAGTAVEVERAGTRAGHQYHLLGHIGSNNSGVVVEPYKIVLSTESDRFQTFQHEGIELLYVLEGRVGYRHGDQTYDLEVGDSLLFDADAPHGPEVLRELPTCYLSVICYPQAK
jgi:transcriptional regulator with XRE-family HTH domain